MNALIKPAPAEVKSCILVHAVNGQAVHSFMTAEQGRAAFDEITMAHGCGTILAMGQGEDVELVYDVSANLRDRVEEAKASIRKQLEWKAALDRHNVPADAHLRKSIYRAIQDIQDRALPITHAATGRAIQ